MTIRISSLLWRVNQMATEAYCEVGANITIRQASILSALVGRRPVPQMTIMERTGIDKSTLSEMILRMAKSGLVSVERTDPQKGDGRLSMVRITHVGRQALKQADPALRAADEAVISRMAISDRPCFQKAIKDIAVYG